MGPLRLRLPATSANLGPGFDALGLAMDLWLELEACEAERFSIDATGRGAEVAGSLERNLILETYRGLAPQGPALALKLRNRIPLGMGCGSSAAALLAGVWLANHFGGLDLSPEQVLAKACRLEGHPDNVAACFYGGLTASAVEADGRVAAASFGHGLGWRFLLALPRVPLSTAEARALLPETYTRADAVANVQATALLVSAFALARPELLRAGTLDRIHQPYRMQSCPLLARLLPLAGQDGIYSVTLSGAGPSVLLIADPAGPLETMVQRVREVAGDAALEVVETRVATGATADPESRPQVT